MSYVAGFDDVKNYYVYKYVIDKVSGEATEFEGEIMGFVKATDPFEACEKLGCGDMNLYGANYIDNLDDFTKAIADERKHLTKISKQLKEMTDERDAERKKFLEERKCPNCDIKMDKAWRCDKCGYGHEASEAIEQLDKVIEEEKANGNDVGELEDIRKALQEEIDRQNEIA